MEYDIYELMRGVQDDSVPLPEDGAAGLRRIKELTMNKIQEIRVPAVCALSAA